MNTNINLIERMRWGVNVMEQRFIQQRLNTKETAVVETEYGKIKGVKRMSIYHKPHYCFEGIPYAQPPIGELRFKSPQRPTPWEGIKDCTRKKSKAVQMHLIYNIAEGSEDCLYLNVYTNNLKPDLPRPVMVWIHGGGFVTGEASPDFYGPDYFMEKNVVLIAIQYRLGVLGFLSLRNPSLFIPGNAGLKDQVMALKWIKNNCSNFGGNPDCITVFGESAGGASTHYMSMTKQTQGLFHRAILMSGCGIAQWAHTRCQNRAFTLAKILRYRGENNDEDVYKFLMRAKAKDLIRVENKVLTTDERKNRVMFPFCPTVEPYETADSVIPKHPREMMRTAWGNSIPTLIGNTSAEGLIFLPETKLDPSVFEDMETCVPFVPHDLRGNDAYMQSYNVKIIENAHKIKNAHIPAEIQPKAEHYFDLCTVMHFLFPMHRMLQSRLSYAGEAAPIYIYRFDFDSEELTFPYRIIRWGRGVRGVGHGDDLAYLFCTVLARRMPNNSREYRTIQRMIGIWTKFAIDGNPHDPEIDGMGNIIWEPVKKSDKNYKCLNISNEFEIIEIPENEKMRRWASMYIDRINKFI